MADLQKIVDDLSALTVLEAAELAKLLEEKWGVSAAAAVAVKCEGDSPCRGCTDCEGRNSAQCRSTNKIKHSLSSLMEIHCFSS